MKRMSRPSERPIQFFCISRTLSGQRSSMIERFQQVFRVIADLEHPLVEIALLDRRAASPAAAVDHLLVGEHGLVDRVPVNFAVFARDQALAEKIEEQLLLVLVIGRVAGRELARPVERQPHGLQLLLHRRDVVVGPGLGVDLLRHGGVLGRHAEGVPAHRVQHGVAHGAFEARHHVAHGVVAHVAHVDAAGGVGEHLQHVVFGLGVVVRRGEDAALGPQLLPAGLGLAGVVAVGARGFLRFGSHLGVFVGCADEIRKGRAGVNRRCGRPAAGTMAQLECWSI